MISKQLYYDSNDVLEKIVVPFGAAGLGAILAFRYQNRQKKRQYKVQILSTLMAYRYAGPDEDDFVNALNMTDIVFHDNSKVRELLHKYFEYTKTDFFTGGQRVAVFFDLLIEMGKDIGYKDLKHDDVSNFFTPKRPRRFPEDPQQPAE